MTAVHHRVQKRIRKELAYLSEYPVDGVTVETTEDNPLEWKCTIKPAADSPYKDGTFHLTLMLPDNYPDAAPTVAFTTRIFHPKISQEGAICIPELGEWRTTLTLWHLLLLITSELNNPSSDDPFEPDIAALLKDDKTKFLATAKEFTERFAMNCAPPADYLI